MNKIEEIASKHLGKAGDGTVVKPYITPDEVDSSLLVGVPRELNRTAYGITNNDFSGVDVWHGYEVSCLMQNGMPLNFVMRVEYPSNSECIVESKSFKLYLNSFNLMRIPGTVDEVTAFLCAKISTDLETIACTGKTNVQLFALDGRPQEIPDAMIMQKETHLEYEVLNSTNYNVLDVEFNEYTEDPSLIVLNDVPKNEVIRSTSLRSNCRVTNQPDWGDIVIAYEADKSLDYLGLLKYIVSMRKENHFHEEICEAVFKRLVEKFGDSLKNLTVMCNYTRRGGISIEPIRTTNVHSYHYKTLLVHTSILAKTERQ